MGSQRDMTERLNNNNMILHKQNRVLASVAGKDSGYSYRTGRTERWRHWWYLPTPPLLNLHTAQAAYCGHLRLSARAFFCPGCERSESRSVVSDSLQPHGLYSPWNSLGQNIGVGR